MSEDKNKPSSGNLYKSKYKTNDGSEEDRTREDYYGTYRDVDGKVWKLKGYINKGQYGTWLKIYTQEMIPVKYDTHFDENGSSSVTRADDDVKKDEFEDEVPF
tara:strand:- start:86 stop:394 length:309 start_codon:yes stop_codon:yes gene_type:complete